MMKKQAVTAVFVVLLAAGCGYHFAPGGTHIDPALTNVYVESFPNLTGEAGVDNYVRNAFIDQFRTSDRFSLVYDKNAADLVLSGTITGVSTAHVSYAKTDVAREDRVIVTLDVEFRDVRGGKVLWEHKSLSEREAYVVQSDPNSTAGNRRDALLKLSGDLAEKAYRDLMSGF
jgi:hypothetical protein